MDLIDDRGAAAQPVHDLPRDLEAQIHLRGADVEEQIARGRHGVVLLPVDLRKWMQLRRARSAEQPVPGRGSDAHDNGEPAVRDAEADRSLQSRAIAQQVADDRFAGWIDGHHKEDRRACQRAEHRLRGRTDLRIGGPGHGYLLDAGGCCLGTV